MQSSRSLPFIVLAVAAAFFATRVSADVVETKNGSRIVGKIVKTEAGVIEVETDDAGVVKIKQSQVVALSTDAPVAVRFESGTRMDGRVSVGASGLQVAGAEGTVSTTVDKIAATWTAGLPDPLFARDWAYQAAIDVNGKSGNKSQLGTSASFRAILAGAKDKLEFYSAYDRQVTDGTKSADQLKAGVDYSNNFRDRSSWYVRDEGGYDRIKDITFYNIAAVGFGYDLIKNPPRQTLTARVGVSFRSENYRNPVTPDVSAAGLDVGLNHTLQLAEALLVNRIAWVPTFDDFGNFRLTHESYYEQPLTNPAWKLRVGLSNDYNSKPAPGLDKLDTSYFTRLVLTWK
jgi:hypothetical protein